MEIDDDEGNALLDHSGNTCDVRLSRSRPVDDKQRTWTGRVEYMAQLPWIGWGATSAPSKHDENNLDYILTASNVALMAKDRRPNDREREPSAVRGR